MIHLYGVIQMKTLIINGSPRPHGNTAFLIDLLKGSLMGDTDIINVYDMSFSPCTDCRMCKKSRCAFTDDASELMDKIDSYDNIAAATPLYYNQPTGMFMSLMSRNQVLYNQNKIMRPKKGAVIITGGGNSVIDTADCEKTLRIVLKCYNAKVLAYARSLHTDSISAADDTDVKADISKIADIFNSQ